MIENAQPVLTWLKEAEEESEEESDDDIAVSGMIAIANKSCYFQFGEESKESEFLRQQREKAAREEKLKAASEAKATNGNGNAVDDEDDLDIDDI